MWKKKIYCVSLNLSIYLIVTKKSSAESGGAFESVWWKVKVHSNVLEKSNYMTIRMEWDQLRSPRVACDIHIDDVLLLGGLMRLLMN